MVYNGALNVVVKGGSYRHSWCLEIQILRRNLCGFKVCWGAKAAI